MPDALDHARASSTLTASASRCDGRHLVGPAEAHASRLQPRGALRLLWRLVLPHRATVSYIDAQPVDTHTLDDIGVSRVEMLYCDPK